MSVLRPDRMHLMRLVILKKDLAVVSGQLLKWGAVHLEKASNFVYREPSYKPVQTRPAQADLRDLKQDLKEIAKALGIKLKHQHSEPSAQPPYIDPLNFTATVRSELSALMEKVDSLRQTAETSQAKVDRLEILSQVITMLDEHNLDPEMFGPGTFSAFEIGLIPADALEPLQSALNSIPHCLEHTLYPGSTLIIVCLGTLKSHVPFMRKALKAAQFKPVSIPLHVLNDQKHVESELEKARDKTAKARSELADLKKKESTRLQEWWSGCTPNLRILEVMEHFLQSKAGFFLAAWVPSKKINDLERDIVDTLDGNVWIDSVQAEQVSEVIEKQVTVPTFLDHPWWLRPFKTLVEIYGQPAYNNLDPTLLFAVSFVTMFGMMFGDIGHGAVLILFGMFMLVACKTDPFLKNFGAIVVYCGMSSAVFGFLFGSVFGNEHLFSPAWFNPLMEPLKSLRVGIELGVIFLSLALLFNLIQCLLAGRIRQGLFGQWGLASTLFYWGAIVFALDVTKSSGQTIPYWGVALMLGVPLLAVTAGDFFFWKWRSKAAGKDSDGEPKTSAIPNKETEKPELAETLFKPVEIVMGFLANTVSFIRVAAFALNHAALMMAVFEIQSLCGTGLLNTGLGLLVGNLMVVVLESIVVFIQCLRLEYYEIFSKIFNDTGRKFEALSKT